MTHKEKKALYESIMADVAKKVKARLNESEDQYPVLDMDKVNKVMDKIMKDEWISTVYDHYQDIKENKYKEEKYLEESLRRYVASLFKCSVDIVKVVLGWYMMTIDIDCVFKKGENVTPAYVHMCKKDGVWDKSGIYKRGH